jgi:hypothetical protein
VCVFVCALVSCAHAPHYHGSYVETYYFSIQFVVYLVGAAAIALFFVIVFDIGWVVARFMIARVTFVQENACRSCQAVFDISRLPRKCEVCTFFYCRPCTFQTRIIPGFAAPQHVCTMCMLQSRQSIVRELEDLCGAGARKNRAVVGLVGLVIRSVQASRDFNLALQKYNEFLNNGKRSVAISPVHTAPVGAGGAKAAARSKRKEIKEDSKRRNKKNGSFAAAGSEATDHEPEFRPYVTRFRSGRIFAELREVVGCVVGVLLCACVLCVIACAMLLPMHMHMPCLTQGVRVLVCVSPPPPPPPPPIFTASLRPAR